MNRAGRVLLGAACLSVMATQAFAAGEPNQPSRRVLTLRPTRTPELRMEFNYDYGHIQPAFEKEPALEGKLVIRGSIPTVPPTPLIRNITDGQIYAKADHDPDFTRGSLATYTSQCRDGAHVYFEGMQVSSRQGSLSIPYTVDLWTYKRGFMGWLNVRSGWSAPFKNGDKSWMFTVVDNLDGKIDGQDRLILDCVTVTDGAPLRHDCPMPEVLFLDGRTFRLDFTYKEAETGVVLEATLTDLQLPMGGLQIDANDCRSLALRDDRRIVLLSNPAGALSVPAGRYRIDNCILGRRPDQVAEPQFAGCDAEVDVQTDQTATLRVGLPLNNSFVVTRDRNLLHLSYQLVGAGGERYYHDQGVPPPAFHIYKGPVRIATGSFGVG